MTTEQRLERLERENRWMKRAGLLVIAGVAVVLLAAQAKPRKTAEAREFVVTDANGIARGRLGITDNGLTSFLALYDTKGEQCVRLSGSPEHGFPSLRMGHIRKGIEYVRLTAGPGPKANKLVMFGQSRDTKLVLKADEGGLSPSITLLHEGSPAACMAIGEGGKPELWMRNTKTRETIWKAPKD